MQKITAIILMIFCLSMAGRVNSAEHRFTDYEGLLIEEIRFEGNEDVADWLLCDVLPIVEGARFYVSDLEESKKAILGLDKFSSAEVDVRPGEQGVVVTFIVTEKWYVMSVPGVKKPPRGEYECRVEISQQDLLDLEGLLIEEIRFEGNQVTREITLRQELLFDVGDSFTKDNLTKSRQSIQNLSLFKKVDAWAEPGRKGVIVTFSVVEKWYILPLPKLDVSGDGDINYGLELIWDNVLGLNQRIKFLVEQEDQADGETEQKTSLQYSIAKIPKTPYGVGVKVERKRILRESEDDEGIQLGHYYAYTDMLHLGMSRWFKRTAPSQGWRGVVGITWENDYSDAKSGSPELPDDHRQLNLGVSGGYTAVNDKEIYRTGQEFGGAFGFGRKWLGSDEDYYNLYTYWRKYTTIHTPIWSNVNFQLRGGYNHGQVDQFELGGGSTMRGILKEDALTGDVFALLNVEWLIPQAKIPTLRWNIFTDIGNAWSRDEVNLLKLEKTFGVGARWKIRSLVNVSLRLDIGYNPDDGEYKVYVGTNNMF